MLQTCIHSIFGDCGIYHEKKHRKLFSCKSSVVAVIIAIRNKLQVYRTYTFNSRRQALAVVWRKRDLAVEQIGPMQIAKLGTNRSYRPYFDG